MAGEVSLVRPSGKLLRAALFAVLHCAGAGPSLAESGELIKLGGLAKLRLALIDAWDASMPEPEPQAPRSDDSRAKKPLTLPEAWGVARENLRLSDQEWLAMTPRMLQVLTRQRLENMRWMELMMGTVVAFNANFSPCHPKQPFAPKSFMFHPWPEEMDDHGVSGEEIMSVFAQLPNPREPRSIN